MAALNAAVCGRVIRAPKNVFAPFQLRPQASPRASSAPQEEALAVVSRRRRREEEAVPGVQAAAEAERAAQLPDAGCGHEAKLGRAVRGRKLRSAEGSSSQVKKHLPTVWFFFRL